MLRAQMSVLEQECEMLRRFISDVCARTEMWDVAPRVLSLQVPRAFFWKDRQYYQWIKT
jgi:hypothetical protein